MTNQIIIHTEYTGEKSVTSNNYSQISLTFFNINYLKARKLLIL